MTELPYNRSLLVTNKSWIQGGYSYRVPSQFSFRGISVKQVIINNPPNIADHYFDFSLYRNGAEIPEIQRLEIPEGSYLPSAYKEVLRDKLIEGLINFGVSNLQDDLGDELGNSNITVFVQYYDASGQFHMRFKNNSNHAFQIKFSDPMCTYLGINDETYNIPPTGPNSPISFKSTTMPTLSPRYYVVRSSSLLGYGFMHNDSESDIIAIIPHSQGNSPTSFYDQSETHLHSLYSDIGELHHNIELQFFVEESTIPIYNPSFLITFVTTI